MLVGDKKPVNFRKRSVVLAWLLCLFCIIVASAQVLAWLLNQSRQSTFFELVEVFGWGWVLPVIFSVLAGMIIARQPRNRVGWLLMLPALVTAASPEWLLVNPPAALTPGLWLLLWFDTWSWIPVIFPVFLIPLHFPTGHPPSAKWDWVNLLAIGMWIYFMALVAFDDSIGPLNYEWRLPNPIGFIPAKAVEGPLLIIWGIGLVTVVLASVVSLFVRYRRAQVIERQQIKWLLYAGAFFVVVYIVIYLGVIDTEDPSSASGWVNLLLVISILAFPVAITIAILRYRLFDIDVLIRKTAVYSVLTAVLALIYFGAVILLQTLVGRAVDERSPLVIVTSTLLIAALFTPLRRRIQDVIDRRFFRKKYDAQQVLAQFAQLAGDEVNMKALQEELLQAIQETMQPEQVALWLRTGEKK